MASETRTHFPRIRASVLDATGRRVPLAFRIERPNDDSEIARRILAASNIPHPRPSRHQVIRGILYGLASLPLFIMMAVAPAYLTFQLKFSGWATFLAMLPIAFCPSLFTAFLTRRLAAAQFARIYLRANYCPSCLYDLISIKPDRNARRTCPECGSIWQPDPETLDRVLRLQALNQASRRLSEDLANF